MGFGTWLSRDPRPAFEPLGAQLSVTLEQSDSRTRVRLEGELDLSNSDAFAARLATVESHNPAVLEIDVRGLTFMDSSGLGELFAANRRAREQHRRLVLVKDHGPVERLLNLACVGDVMDVVELPTAA